MDFPSLKPRQLRAILEREPLGYSVARQHGSHRHMTSARHPPLTFAWHDKATLPPGAVRKILMQDVRLTEIEAAELLGLKHHRG